MDSKPLDDKGNARRKMKFAPKAPPRRVPKPEVKSEPVENDNAAQAMDLLRRINEGSMKVKPKAEKKVPASQVAWFGGVANSSSMRSYGAATGGSSSSRTKAGFGASSAHDEEEYKEPWDYYSYYPITLPIRRPYSGNPERLDQEEFGEGSQTASFDENSINSALELGLMEDNSEPSMIFIQIPDLPMLKRPVATDKPSEGSRAEEKLCSLHDLPEGFMGKMRVYKSGAVKLQLGETIYDVDRGMNCKFAQDVVAVNMAEKHCSVVGELNKMAVVTPNIDSILNDLDNL